jgi:hypothetical protein
VKAIAALCLVAGVAAADPKPAAWDVTVPESVSLSAGGSATIDMTIAPGAGRTISRDGPVRIDVRVPDGVTATRRRLSLTDAVDPGAAAPAFAIKVGAAKAGTYSVEIGVRVWLCLRQTCKPVKTTRTVRVEAK